MNKKAKVGNRNLGLLWHLGVSPGQTFIQISCDLDNTHTHTLFGKNLELFFCFMKPNTILLYGHLVNASEMQDTPDSAHSGNTRQNLIFA